MTTSAKAVRFDGDSMWVHLDDGRVIAIRKVVAVAICQENHHAVAFGAGGHDFQGVFQSGTDAGAAPEPRREFHGTEKFRRAFHGRGVRGQRDPLENAIAKDNQTKGVAFALVHKTQHGGHCRVVAVAVAIGGSHGAGDIDEEFDIGHDALVARHAPAPGARHDDDHHGKKEQGKRVHQPQVPGHPGPPGSPGVVKGHGHAQAMASPLPDQSRQRQHQQEQNEWIGEAHGRTEAEADTEAAELVAAALAER